jgi:hypothetical protein
MFEYAAYSPMPSGYVPLLGASVTLDVHNLLPSVYSYTDDEDGDVITGFMTSTPHFTYIRTQGAQGEVPPFLNKRFPVSGQSFMRTSFNQASPGQSTWLSFNAGKWRNAHCHLDALAITYYSDGLALMPDGGLYEYANTATSARAAVVADYFNGTSAHNTVVVDGASQSNEPQFVDNVTEGLVVSGDGWGYQSASHQLYAGVTHSRSVVLLGQDAAIVFDHLTGSDAHDYTQTWHLWTDAAIATTGLDVAATGSNGNGGTAALALHQGITDGVKLTSVKGQNEPVVQGFYSDNYEHIYANYALEYTQHASQANFATLITSGDRAAVTPVLKTDFDTDGNISATVCAGDIDVEIVIEDQVRPGENVKVTSFKGCP